MPIENEWTACETDPAPTRAAEGVPAGPVGGGPDRLGDFVLLRELGQGSFARVYLAHQVGDGDIRRCQFLTIAPVTWQPGYLYIIAQFIHLIATSSTNRLIGTIIYLTSGNDRHNFI